MANNQDKSENQKAQPAPPPAAPPPAAPPPAAPPPARVEGVFPEQLVEKLSVPVSTTLPSALIPAEPPNQPTTPTNEATNQPPPPPPTTACQRVGVGAQHPRLRCRSLVQCGRALLHLGSVAGDASLEPPPPSTPALAAVVPGHGSTGGFFVPDVLERHDRRVPSTGFHQVR